MTVPVLKGEAFGLYLLEALSAGIPIVQPDLAAFPEIVSETGGGDVFSPNSPEALSQKWAEILEHPERLEKWSVDGRANVEEKYSMKKLTLQMVSVYESIVNK